MITLYKFGPHWRLPDLSPFAIKVETYLRMVKLPYESRIGEPRKAPKNKLPYIVEDDGRTIADSSLILEHLQKKLGDPLEEARFSAEERATARAFKALFESELYFIIAYTRWWNDDSFAIYRPALMRYCEGVKAPRLLWSPILAMVRRQTKSQVHQAGIARHDRATVDRMGKEIIDAAADHLGDKPYFMGDRPSLMDTTAFGFLAGVLWAPFEGPILDHARTRPNLDAYCERMHKAYFSEPVSP